MKIENKLKKSIKNKSNLNNNQPYLMTIMPFAMCLTKRIVNIVTYNTFHKVTNCIHTIIPNKFKYIYI